MLSARHPWALVDDAGAPAALRLDQLASIISLLPPPTREATIFAGVSRVPAGVTLEVTGDGAVERQVSTREIEPLQIRSIDAAEELWRLVLASVGRAIGKASCVGVMVGGGVDSSALLAAAFELCNRAGKKLIPLALHHGGEGDDRPHLSALENFLRVEVVRITPRETAGWMLPLLKFSGLPIWAATASTDYALMRRGRELGADIVLTGLGGDEVFDGHPHLLSSELARGDLSAIRRAAALQVPWRTTAPGRAFNFAVRPLIGRILPTEVQRARRHRLHSSRWSWAGPVVKQFIREEATAWTREELVSPQNRFESLSKSTYLAEAIEFCETLSLLAGSPVAHPYLDPDLHAFMSSLSPSMLLHAGRARGLFRLAMRGRVPSSVRHRPDKAQFAVAQKEIFDALGGVKVLGDLVNLECSAALGLVDPSKFVALVRDFPERARRDLSTWSVWSAWWPTLAVEGFLRARDDASVVKRSFP